MFLRFFLILSIFLIPGFAKKCYWEKNKRVCLKRFYDIKELKKPTPGEKYYINKKNNQIFTYKDKILIKLKYKGAILYILENFEVKFHDKKNYGTLVLKVNNPNEILSIITNLNHLDSVKEAKLQTSRVYRKSYVKPKYEIRAEEKEKRMKSSQGKQMPQKFFK